MRGAASETADRAALSFGCPVHGVGVVTDTQQKNPWMPFYHFLKKFSSSVGQIYPTKKKALRLPSKSLIFLVGSEGLEPTTTGL